MFHQRSFRSRSFGPFGPRSAGAPNDWRRTLSLLRTRPTKHLVNNRTSRVTSFLPTSNPSPISGRLGHQKVHWERSRTPWAEPKTPESLQINLLFTMYAEQAHCHLADANFYFFKDKDFLRSRDLSVLNTKTLVELSGIEPLTPCLQSRCSPS